MQEAFPAFRSTPLRTKRSWYVTLVGCGVLALVTGCGSATAAPSTAAAATASSVSAAGASQPAYAACLREHGAVAPTAKPTADAAGGHKGPGAIPTAARQACASLRPHPNQKNTALEAFNACMSAHGETIPPKQPDPAATPKPTGTARFLHGLNPGNAQVAAALKACDSKLPTTAANG